MRLWYINKNGERREFEFAPSKDIGSVLYDKELYPKNKKTEQEDMKYIEYFLYCGLLGRIAKHEIPENY